MSEINSGDDRLVPLNPSVKILGEFCEVLCNTHNMEKRQTAIHPEEQLCPVGNAYYKWG